jgi:hypothetical protein
MAAIVDDLMDARTLDIRSFDYGERWAGLINTSPLSDYKGHYAQAVRIAAGLRHQLPRCRSLLFHGTPNPKAIIRAGGINASPFGFAGVSLTRSLHIAVHYALLERDAPEPTSAVLVFDRDELVRHGYRPYPVYEDHFEEIRAQGSGIAEEVVKYDFMPLRPFLLNVLRIAPIQVAPVDQRPAPAI